MKLLLSSDESFIGFIIESYVSEDSSCHEGANLFNLNNQSITEGSTVIVVVGADREIAGHFSFYR